MDKARHPFFRGVVVAEKSTSKRGKSVVQHPSQKHLSSYRSTCSSLSQGTVPVCHTWTAVHRKGFVHSFLRECRRPGPLCFFLSCLVLIGCARDSSTTPESAPPAESVSRPDPDDLDLWSYGYNSSQRVHILRHTATSEGVDCTMWIECRGTPSFPDLYFWIPRGDFNGWGGTPGYDGDWPDQPVINLTWGEENPEPTKMNLSKNTFTFQDRKWKDKMMSNDILLMELPWEQYGSLYFYFDLREGRQLLSYHCL